MPRGLRRIQQSGQSHFVTFSCYHRRLGFTSPEIYDLFLQCLEKMRQHFAMCIYGYVVMPEHVHLLVNEPGKGTLADAIHFLKLSFAKRVHSVVPPVRPMVAQVRVRSLDANLGSSFWQKRYYDRNVRDADEFKVKLRYLHRNPVKRGLVQEPGDWKWSSFRHYAFRETAVVQIESEWTAQDRETRRLGGPPRVFLNPG